jgi:acyl carrier protein
MGPPSPVTRRRNLSSMSDANQLDDAIRLGLGLPVEVDVTAIAYGRTEQWDSVAHMQLVVAIEDTFGIMIETDDVIAMSSYQEIRRILHERHGLLADA